MHPRLLFRAWLVLAVNVTPGYSATSVPGSISAVPITLGNDHLFNTGAYA
jgi:hypothetical protein